MNRTLTVFEAMLINIASKANSLKIRDSAPDEFPTLQEVSEFFQSLEITQQNLFTLGLDLTTEGGKLVDDMISTSKRWYEAGLYFGPVELFRTRMKSTIFACFEEISYGSQTGFENHRF